MSDVRIVSLSGSGIEIIGDLVSGSETVYPIELENVLIVVFHPDTKTKKLTFDFLPYGLAAKGTTKKFKEKDVCWIDVPEDGILNAYQQITGAIVTPPTSPIMLQ